MPTSCLQATSTQCRQYGKCEGATVFRVETADGLRRAPDRATPANDDTVDVERDGKGWPRRRGVRKAPGEIRWPAALRDLELRLRSRPRRAGKCREEAPHASGPRRALRPSASQRPRDLCCQPPRRAQPACRWCSCGAAACEFSFIILASAYLKFYK